MLSSSQSNLPIGTILPYVGDLGKIPKGWALCDGNNGTPDLSNRFLEGVTNNPKQFKDAGLPNITGSFPADDMMTGKSPIGSGWVPPSGAFYRGSDQYIDFNSDTTLNYGAMMQFDASHSSSVYGQSDTVQPASYTVYYIMKIA